MATIPSRETPFVAGKSVCMTPQVDFLAEQAVARFLGVKSCDSIDRVPTGISGGAVYRCHTPKGTFALKRWPQQTSHVRISEVHRVQRFVGEVLPAVPQLTSLPASGWTSGQAHDSSAQNPFCLEMAGYRFDLSSWRPGKPFDGNTPNAASEASVLKAIRSGAAAIAQFHRRSESLGQSEIVAPAVTRRWARLGELQTLLPQTLANGSQLRGPARRAIDLLATGRTDLQRASEACLRPWLNRPVPTLWVLRDVHREHILFVEGEVTGMVDFDAVNRDTRATDLARWVGSFAEFGHPITRVWPAAIEGYRQQQMISACEQELAGAIEEASWFIHLANWVIWTTIGNRDIPGGLEAAERRIERLLRRNHV